MERYECINCGHIDTELYKVPYIDCDIIFCIKCRSKKIKPLLSNIDKRLLETLRFKWMEVE